MTAPPAKDLGETTNANELVPGNPGRIRELGDAFARRGTAADETASALRAVRIPSWTGNAADTFWDLFASAPKGWIELDNTFTVAVTALNAHADRLTSAQSKAQDAIEKWQAGERATEQARATAEANRVKNTPVIPTAPDTVHDIGESMRIEAREILQEARTDVEESGRTCALAIAEAVGGWLDTSESGFFGASGSLSWGKLTIDQWRRSFDKYGEKLPNLGLSASLYGMGGSAWIYQSQRTWVRNSSLGEIQADGNVSVGKLDGGVAVGFDRDNGVVLKGQMNATVVGLNGSVGLHNDYSNVAVGLDAKAGGFLQGEASITRDGAIVGGEALAGVKVGGEVKGDVGGLGAEGGAEAWVGVGVEAKADVGFEDGKAHAKVEFGGGLGFGGSVSIGVTVDTEAMKNTAGNLVHSVRGWF